MAQVPPPPPPVTCPRLLVSRPTDGPVALNDYAQWWKWMPASWQHPEGPGSDIEGGTTIPSSTSPGTMPSPARRAGKRLPTEASVAEKARRRPQQPTLGRRRARADGRWRCEHLAGATSPTEHGGRRPARTAPVKSYLPGRLACTTWPNVWEWRSTATPGPRHDVSRIGTVVDPFGPQRTTRHDPSPHVAGAFVPLQRRLLLAAIPPPPPGARLQSDTGRGAGSRDDPEDA